MIRFALGAKSGIQATLPSSSSLPPEKRSGINSDPSATLPIPKLRRDKNRLLFTFNPFSKISFAMTLFGYGLFQVINGGDHLHHRCKHYFISMLRHRILTNAEDLFSFLIVTFKIIQLVIPI